MIYDFYKFYNLEYYDVWRTIDHLIYIKNNNIVGDFLNFMFNRNYKV